MKITTREVSPDPAPTVTEATLVTTRDKLRKISHAICYLKGEKCLAFTREEVMAAAEELWATIAQ